MPLSRDGHVSPCDGHQIRALTNRPKNCINISDMHLAEVDRADPGTHQAPVDLGTDQLRHAPVKNTAA
jgi:hypothetical protein